MPNNIRYGPIIIAKMAIVKPNRQKERQNETKNTPVNIAKNIFGLARENL